MKLGESMNDVRRGVSIPLYILFYAEESVGF